MSNTHCIRVMRAVALGFCCAVVAMVAAPSANAAYTDYRCDVVGNPEDLVDALLAANFPPVATMGLNCKPLTGNGGKPVLLFVYRNGYPSYGCTSYNPTISPNFGSAGSMGIGAGCNPIAKPVAAAQDTGLSKQRRVSRARARKSH